jgi:hypothetical protein
MRTDRTDDGWIIFYKEDGKTELIRIKPPEGVGQLDRDYQVERERAAELEYQTTKLRTALRESLLLVVKFIEEGWKRGSMLNLADAEAEARRLRKLAEG